MKYKRGYKYQLVAPETFYTSVFPPMDIEDDYCRLTHNGLLTLFAGYCWDGASGAVDTKTNIRASACHDALCQLVQNGKLDASWKDQADKEYYKLCLRDGMNPVRAMTHWWAIKFHDWTKTPVKPILEIAKKAVR